MEIRICNSKQRQDLIDAINELPDAVINKSRKNYEIHGCIPKDCKIGGVYLDGEFLHTNLSGELLSIRFDDIDDSKAGKYCKAINNYTSFLMNNSREYEIRKDIEHYHSSAVIAAAIKVNIARSNGNPKENMLEFDDDLNKANELLVADKHNNL